MNLSDFQFWRGIRMFVRFSYFSIRAENSNFPVLSLDSFWREIWNLTFTCSKQILARNSNWISHNFNFLSLSVIPNLREISHQFKFCKQFRIYRFWREIWNSRPFQNLLLNSEFCVISLVHNFVTFVTIFLVFLFERSTIFTLVRKTWPKFDTFAAKLLVFLTERFATFTLVQRTGSWFPLAKWLLQLSI